MEAMHCLYDDLILVDIIVVGSKLLNNFELVLELLSLPFEKPARIGAENMFMDVVGRNI